MGFGIPSGCAVGISRLWLYCESESSMLGLLRASEPEMDKSLPTQLFLDLCFIDCINTHHIVGVNHLIPKKYIEVEVEEEDDNKEEEEEEEEKESGGTK
ncbi:hypothetical protein KQX54_001345 [Cotesia glomerata]|uniref:Uncharacterized protein n=1 Tax=Cotesia glomerata TaxID=32391 RepID=A0AAV7INS0_COTGL|nr:hypothetical protein KQX54_001345 [Cotesia glomerata]